MKSIRVYSIIPLLLFIFSNNMAYGQKHFEWDWPSPWERVLWKDMQVSYKLPTGFKFWLSDLYNEHLGMPVYYDSMNSPDGNFAILIEAVEYIHDQSRINLYKTLSPNNDLWNMDQDSVYLKHVEEDMKKSLGDKYKSLDKCPIKYYSKKAAKKKFNADYALTYPIVLKKHSYGKEFCQVIVIQKNKRGTLRLLCFYNKKSRPNLKKYLKMAEEVFYFRDPEDFVPYPESKKDSVITLPDIRRN